MNLTEKLAAADTVPTGAGAAEPAPGDPPRNRRAGDPGGPPVRSGPGPLGPPGVKGHPMRRSSDRAALDEAWKVSKQKVQAKVLAEIGPTAADLSSAELRDKVRSTVNEIFEREDLGISPIERQRFVEEILEDSLGYGPLEALLADNSITEIMCNAYDEIWIERKGRIERCEIAFATPNQYRRIIDRMVHAVGRRVDESSPMVDARLADGSRINAIVPPLALRGPVLTIRKFPERAFLMQDLLNLGTLSMDAAVFLEACVRGKVSMVVVGGTGTGKTTMLNVLSNFIPDGERLITIEESAELQIQGAHVVTLETRPANAEGTGEVRIRDLVRNSLRMRPDRIIVGECRGSETLDMLQAMNTGHAGSMTTVHANTPRELLGRLETMVMMGGVELPAARHPGADRDGHRTPGATAADPGGPPRGAFDHRAPGNGRRHRPAPGHLPPGRHARGDGTVGVNRAAPQDPRRTHPQRDRRSAAPLPQRHRRAVGGVPIRRASPPAGASRPGDRATERGALRDPGPPTGRSVGRAWAPCRSA